MIDILIILIYITLGAAITLTLWSIVRKVRTIGKVSGKRHGIPVTMINIVVNTLAIAILAVSYLIGDTETMIVNNSEYTDKIWLSVTDMFVTTGLLLLLIGIVAVTAASIIIGNPKEVINSLVPISFTKVKRKGKRKK